MNNLFQLLKVNLLSFYGINKIRYSKDKDEKDKNKRQLLVAVIGFVVILYISFYYGSLMLKSFAPFKAEHLLLAMAAFITSVFTLFSMIYKVNGFLFNFKDYDMVSSLPIKNSTIVISRILVLYVMSMITTLLFMIPFGTVYCLQMKPDLYFYLMFIVTLIFLPLIPIIIGTFIGTIITLISGKFKKRNILSILLTLIFVLGISYFSTKMETDITMLYNMADALIKILNDKYPFINMYMSGLVDKDILEILKFTGISIGLFAIFTFIISKYFNKINTFLSGNKTNSKYKEKRLKKVSVRRALLKKEFKRYFSSSNYVLNTSIGLILLTIASILIVIFGSEKVESLIQFEGFSNMINNFAPLVLSVFVSLSCTTSSSISLEGKSFWLLKTLPLETKDILLSKVMMNVIVCTIPIIINSTILGIYLHSSLLNIIFMYVIPLLFAVLISCIGIILNLYSNSFDWKNEIFVIKQSLPSMLSIFLGMGLSVGAVALVNSVSLDINILLTMITLILLIIDIILYLFITRKGVKVFEKI